MKLLNRFCSLVVLALFLVQFQNSIGMEGGDWAIGDNDIITIQTADNKEIKLPYMLVKQSAIPVPNLTEADWKELEHLLKIVADEQGQAEEKIVNLLDEKDIVQLSIIIGNANYLDIPMILHQAIKAIAKKIQTSSQLVLTKNQIKKLSAGVDFKTWKYAQHVIVLNIAPIIERLIADEIFPYFVKLGEIAEDIVKAWRPQKVATVTFGDKNIKIYDNANQESRLIELPNEIEGKAVSAELSPLGTEVAIILTQSNEILVMDIATKNIIYLTHSLGEDLGNAPIIPYRYLNKYNFIWFGDGNGIFLSGIGINTHDIILESYLKQTHFVFSSRSFSDIGLAINLRNAISLVLASDSKGQYLLLGIQKYNYPNDNHFLALIKLWQTMDGKQKELFEFPIHDLLQDLIWNPNDKSFAAKINNIYYEYTFQPYIFEAQWLYQKRHLSDYKSFDKEKIYQSFQELLKEQEKRVEEPSQEGDRDTLFNPLQELTRQLNQLGTTL